MKIIYFFILVFTISVLQTELNIGYCQSGQLFMVKGRVLSQKDNQPIPMVNVAILSSETGTTTNENGYFTLKINSDTATLAFSSIGYKKHFEKISLKSGGSIITIKLNDEDLKIDEVTITAEKDRIVRISENISTVKMSPILIAKLPNMGEVDVMRSFQLLPGVSASNETSVGLFVRGGTPDQNLILFDGMTIYHVDHFYGFFSAFNANTIDDIELIKGGFPAKYGGRTSSVMEITGRHADLNKVNGVANISLLSVNGAIDIPIIKQRLSLQVAARRSYTDIIRSGLYNKIFDLYSNEEKLEQPSAPSGMGGMQVQEQQPSFYFYDLNSKLNFILNNKHTLAVSFYSGKDNLDNSRDATMGFNMGGSTSATNSTTDLTGWGNHGISSQWKADWGSKFNSNVFISYSNYFSDRNQSSNTSLTSGTENRGMNTIENNNVKDFSIRLRNQWLVSDNNTLEFGVENTKNKISYSLVFNDTTTMVDKFNEGNLSDAYIQDKITLFQKKLEMNLGLRGVYQDIVNKFYLEPRVSISYELIKGIKLKSAWGKYNQMCTRVIREDVLQGSKDFWLLADDSIIPVSSAIHYIGGVSIERGDYLIDFEAFYKQMEGLTEYSLRSTNSFRIAQSQKEYFYKGSGYAKGLEILVQKKYGNNTGWIAYTLSEVKHTFADLNYGNPYYAAHDQPHEFKAVYCRKLRNFDFSATFVYATGKPYTSPESQYQLMLLDGSTYNYIHVSDKNSLRLPDYHKLDVAISYNWFGVIADKTLSLSVFNVYNRTNIWYKKYEISEDQITVTNVNYLGFTPNISFTFRLK